MRCKYCDHQFSTDAVFGKKRIYILDSNIYIFADNDDRLKGDLCKEVINRNDVATVDILLNSEIPPSATEKFPIREVYRAKRLCDEVRELRLQDLEKQPSEQDLTIIQVAIDNPDIAGIITYDKDFKKLATSGLIQKKSQYKSSFFVGDAEEFLNRLKKKY